MAADDSTKTLYIIDGFAQIFRAYYAILGGMNSPATGEPTAVSFGMAGMLLKLLREYKPDYVAMAIESEGPTFRVEMFPEYKANRDPPPSDLIVQIPRVFELTKAFGVPLIQCEGAEADDVIATIARRIQNDDITKNVQVRIVSKDKDLEQLLSDRVTMVDIHKDTSTDVAALKENKGISPDQVIDVLALMGDKVDNIPGVDGIGPKTAAKLISEYGTMENLLDNIDQIKGKRRENIEKAQEHLPLSKTLVTLKDELEFDFRLEDAAVGGIDATRLRELFHELGFRRHLSDLDRLLDGETADPAPGPDKPVSKPKKNVDANQGMLFDMGSDDEETAEDEGDFTTADDFDYNAVTTKQQLDDVIASIKSAKSISLDTETIGLGHGAKLCGICLAWKPESAVYIPVLSPNPDEHLDHDTVIAALKPVLEDASIPKVGHNLKYDLYVLLQSGVAVRGVTFDTMIAAFLVGAPALNLDWLAKSMLGHKMIPISKLIGPPPKGKRTKQKTMDSVPLDQVTPYAAEDADISLRLYHNLLEQIESMEMTELAARVEMPLVEVLAAMESNGIRLDPQVLEDQKTPMAKRILELKEKIWDTSGYDFNLDSPKQLADVLFNKEKLGLPIVKKTKTGPSTDIEVLERLAEREDLPAEQVAVPRLMVEYRQLTKLVNTYLDALQESVNPDTSRIHASFHQTGAATGRLASSDPNLQNIPIRTDVGRQIRRAFVAEPGHKLIVADYSQIELRILAHLSEDKGLTEAFLNDQDIHTAVATHVFGVAPDEVTTQQRTHAKTINFGIIYGVTPTGLSRRIENLDLPGAKKLIADYKKQFRGINEFMDKCIWQAEENGYVTTMHGRRRWIKEIRSRNWSTRRFGERLAINSVVQGSAADLIKLAMVNLHKRIVGESLPMKLLLQIHDELVVEAPVDQAEAQSAIVRQVMEGAMELTVPLKVDVNIGDDWLEAK